MTSVDRRAFLGVGALALCGAALPARASQKKPTRLILLGTRGGPRVEEPGRRNTSLVLLINGVPYVVDCGYGVSRQLLAAGVPVESVRYVFITHLHSDHALEYGPLLLNGWATGALTEVDAYGPPGLDAMTRAFFESMKVDIDVRIADEGRPDIRQRVRPHDIREAGLVMQNEDVKVSAIAVPHPQMPHALAFRFDAHDRSIVVSGDTAYSPALAEFAKDADVLVHEVMYGPGIDALAKRLPHAKRLREHLVASHTLSEDVGKVAAQANVKTLVLYHFVPGDDRSITDEDWASGARKNFKGRIIVGKDLMEIR